MFGDDYLKQICSATGNEAKMALALSLVKRYANEAGRRSQSVAENQDEFFALAAGVANRIFGEVPSNDFQKEHADTITARAKELAENHALCKILSGAGYNVSYSRYLIAGGSRGMFSNDFLTYIRTFNDPAHEHVREKMRSSILKIGSTILAPIDAMVTLGIFDRSGITLTKKTSIRLSTNMRLSQGSHLSNSYVDIGSSL